MFFYMLDLRLFKKPPASYRPQPFWFWNGEMTENEIKKQISEMAEKGIGGFFICPRQGLTIPYLSNEWFDKVRFAVEKAKEYQLEVWLYDEYPYPSGIAGGEVALEHPEAKSYELIHLSEKVRTGQKAEIELPWARLLYAKAVPINQETEKREWDKSLDVTQFVGNHQAEPVFQKAGLTAYNQKRYFTYKTVKKLSWEVPAGMWELHFFLEKELDDFKYYGTFIDPCNAEAMDTFLKLTHDRYSEALEGHLGETVKGMFTDEIGLLGKLPWSPRLPEFFREQTGYDIRDYLHALIDGEAPRSPKVRYDYFQSIHLLLRDSYHKKVHDWCERHNVQYIAEVPSVRMATQLYSHIPGGDSAHEKIGRSLEWIIDRYALSFRDNPKMISSLSNQLEKQRSLNESFHSVGWSMTLQDAKWMIDRLAAYGINFFNFHAFFYTLDGLKKHDAPPSQFLQNPYWKHFQLLSDYVGRISYIMSCGTPVRSIAVLDPTTSLWTKMANPFHHFAYSGENETEEHQLQALKKRWAEICKTLLLHHKDYDHLDPEILTSAKVEGGQIIIGYAVYSILILPPINNLEFSAWLKIKEFIRQGGKVIANELLLQEEIEYSADIKEDVWNTFGITEFVNKPDPSGCEPSIIKKDGQEAYFISKTEPAMLIDLLNELQEDWISFSLQDGAKSFLSQTRKINEREFLFFMSNQEAGSHKATIFVQNPSFDQFRLLDAETGETKPLKAERKGDGWLIALFFEPYQSCLLQICKDVSSLVQKEKEALHHIELNIKHPWTVQAKRDNVLRLDTFNLTIGEESQQTGTRVQTKTFIDQCADLPKKSWRSIHYKQMFGTPMKMENDYPIQCAYETSFIVNDLTETCHLLMDKGTISGEYKLFLNGLPIDQNGLKPVFFYDHNNINVDIKDKLKAGENKLAVHVKVEHDWDGLVDALYITGNFGVTFDAQGMPVIGSAPGSCLLGEVPHKGFPYYAGELSFIQEFELAAKPKNENFTFSVSDWKTNFHDCAEVIINGTSLGIRAWSPYEWVGQTDILSSGNNQVEIKVTNTLAGMLEGRFFDSHTHELKNVIDVDR